MTSIRRVQAKARQGDSDAQYWLAEAYATGDGVAQDLSRALGLYKKAAARDHPDALYELGFVYLKGEGVRANPQQAVKYFIRAASAGSADAAVLLGDSYREGKIGLESDVEKAAFYYCLAFKLGDSRGGRAMAKLLGKPPLISLEAFREALMLASR